MPGSAMLVPEEVIASPEDMRASYLLTVGDTPLGDKISTTQGEWGTEDSGVVYANLTLTQALPPRLEDESVQFSIVINDEVIPQLAGIDSYSEVGDNNTTNFHSASAGRLANEITLDEEIECEGWYPEQVVRKALSKLPYVRGGVKVEPTGSPVLYFTRARGTMFYPEQHPSNMLSAVLEKAPYVYRDTYTGGAAASAARALGKDNETKRVYSASELMHDTNGQPFRKPPRVEPRYSKVVVFLRNPDDSYAFYAQANVSYRGQKPPVKGRTFYVELEDPTPEGRERAKSLAYDLARGFTRGHHKDEFVLPYVDPWLVRGDSFRIHENFWDLDGAYERIWLGWVDTLKHDIPTFTTGLGYTASILHEDRIKAPALALAGIKVKKTRIADCDEVGDYILFSEDHTWIAEDGDYLQFATGAGTVTDNGDYITISCPGPGTKLWGENPPGVLFFNESVSWVSTVGDVLSIDSASSGGAVSVSGDVITVNDA